MLRLKSVASKSICSKMGCDGNDTAVATSYGNLSTDFLRVITVDKDLLVTIFIEGISTLSFFSNTISEFGALGVVFHI